MNTNNYTQSGLDRLYAAIVRQAEADVLTAIRRDYPGITPEQEQTMMSTYRRVRRMAETRLVQSTMQGEKK